MSTFVTSDTHFCHEKLMQALGYPFSTVEEMDETIIKNWNDTVGKGDVVYHLGDFGWKSHGKDFRLSEIAQRLNGTINLIAGNHDRNNCKKIFSRFGFVKDLHEIKCGSELVVLCHYPIQRWNRWHYGSFHIHGHCHGNLVPLELLRRGDAGIMLHDWRPVPLESFITRLSTL